MKSANPSDIERMKQFIYGEMPDEEAQIVEEELFLDNEFFHELASLENDLIDRYVQKKLTGKELERFEKSLSQSGERQEQVKFARALQHRIAAEKKVESFSPALETSQASIWSKLSGLFNLQSSLLPSAAIGLLILLGIAVTVLLLDSYSMRQELARERSEQLRRETELSSLQENIKNAEFQINDLQKKIDEQGEQNENLIRELEERKAEIVRLKQSSEQIQRQQKNEINKPPGTVLATIISLGGRGGGAPRVLKSSAESVTVQLPIQTESEYESYEVKNAEDQEIAIDKKIISRAGKKYLIATVAAKTVKFSVIGINRERGERKIIGDFRLNVLKR